MGILGCNVILTDPRITRGLYHGRAKRYNIYVDGELIRYKGMTNDNLSHRFVEESIASASHAYLRRLLERVQNHLARKPNLVMVYMDGERVGNKVERSHVYEFDVRTVREVFMKLCQESGYIVCPLERGESELQMFLRRDRESELNVFVTNDSDMISICYGHEARLSDDAHRHSTELRSTIVNGALDSIVDYNYIYAESACDSIRDSCLWIKCATSEIRAYGMDDIARRMKFGTRAFRVFLSACGTDFTRSILTNTMISAILGADEDDHKALRVHETDDLEMLVALVYLAIKNGATLKRAAENDRYAYRANDIRDIIDAYVSYVETGDMKRDSMPSIDGSMLAMEIVYAMTCGAGSFTKSYLRGWSSSVSMARAVHNFKNNVGRYATFVGLKRKMNDDMKIDEDRSNSGGSFNEKVLARLRAAAPKTTNEQTVGEKTVKLLPVSFKLSSKRNRQSRTPDRNRTSLLDEILMDDDV